MTDRRNAYGFPILFRIERAKQYARAAKERNKPQCECEACRMKELEPAVVRITERWQV